MKTLKLNLSKCEGFTSHRSGWSYAIESLQPFHSDSGVLLDDFVERTFIWNKVKSKPYTFPWFGVVHLPSHDRVEFDKRNSLDFLFKSEKFLESLEKCLGLVTLSEYLARQIRPLVKCPVVSVRHPTQSAKFWAPSLYRQNKSISQIGYWLRDFVKCNEFLNKHSYLKTYCLPGIKAQYIDIWNRIMAQEGRDYIVHPPTNLDNEKYDDLLSSTVAVVFLHATSANNGIIEPLIRNTPIITNRLPATVEYLGEDYPIYDVDYINDDMIFEAHEYLKKMDKSFLRGDVFARDLINKLKEVI